MATRQTLHGSMMPVQASAETYVGFQPTRGLYVGAPQTAPLGSSTSLQNLWVRESALQPRWMLSNQSLEELSFIIPTLEDITNPASTGTRLLGVVPFYVDEGAAVPEHPILISATTNNLYFSTLSNVVERLHWSAGSLVPAAGVAYTLSGRTYDNLRGATVYLERINSNIAVVTNGNTGGTPLMAIRMPTTGAFQFSRLTGAPDAADVIAFGNRVVAWDASPEGVGNVVSKRAQWCVDGDPEDWTGIGSGSEDLVAMNGEPTRIFAFSDRMLLSSANEIWQGFYVGLPYVFRFEPLHRDTGIPYPRAAIKTARGLFWLAYGNRILHMVAPGQLTELSAPIQPLLDALRAPEVAFLTYNEQLDHLRLFYSTTATSYPTTSLTYDFRSGVWTREIYAQAFQCGVSAVIPSVQSTNQPATSAPVDLVETLFTSKGTMLHWRTSATSDHLRTVHSEAWFTGVFSGTPQVNKFARELRVVYTADSASSLSVGASANGGNTFVESRVACSASSNDTQVRAFPHTTGDLTVIRLRSQDGGRWKANAVHVWANLAGKSNG